MKPVVRPNAPVVVFTLLVLMALKGADVAGWFGGEGLPFGSRLVRTLSNRNLNKEAREALTAGYYEGLINEGSRLSSMNRLVTGGRRITFEDRSQPDRRETHDFRFYELIPNSETPDYRDGRQRYILRTNSAGLADREYAQAKGPGIRRFALLGDSITRGQGAPYLGNYESLLESQLNEVHVDAQLKGFEILNFAVGSYNLTQMLESAIVRATPYEPDVYIVGMSKLSVYRRWGQHIALLLNAGIDLKYDFLRNVVRESGVSPTDPIGVTDAKLARFRLPTLQWALKKLQAHAATHDAELVVVLLPTVEDTEVLKEEFLGVGPMIEALGIPVVDLVDVFDGTDHQLYRVAHNDFHPNAAGHQLLFERLYEAVLADARLRNVFFEAAPAARPPSHQPAGGGN